MTLTIGIDIGTTRIKLVLRDLSHERTLCAVSTSTPVLRCDAGDTRDPDAVWQALLSLFDEMRTRTVEIDRVSGVSAASVGEEIVFVDNEGRSVSPISTWYSSHHDETDIMDRPINQMASWYAIRRQNRESITNATGFTDLGSYLLMRLAGRSLPVTDLTHACRTGLLRDDAPEWSPDRLKSCGVEHLTPPEILLPGEDIGQLSAEVSLRTGLPVGIPVRIGAHDHIAAAHAAGVHSAGQVFISSGTSETQLLLTSLPWKDLSALERPGLEFGSSVSEGLRYLHMSHPAGRSVAEICADDEHGRSIGDLYEALECLLDDSCDMLSPHSAQIDPAAVQLFQELERQARVSAESTQYLTSLGRLKPRSVTIVGVPTMQRVWRTIRARFARTELVFGTVLEASAVGAALLAAGSVPTSGDADHQSQQNGDL